MQLTMMDGVLTGANISRYAEKPDPLKVAQLLTDERQITPALAMAISTGALLRRTTTIALARAYGLIAPDVLTDARIAGLLT